MATNCPQWFFHDFPTDCPPRTNIPKYYDWWVKKCANVYSHAACRCEWLSGGWVADSRARVPGLNPGYGCTKELLWCHDWICCSAKNIISFCGNVSYRMLMFAHWLPFGFRCMQHGFHSRVRADWDNTLIGIFRYTERMRAFAFGVFLLRTIPLSTMPSLVILLQI